MSQDTSMPLMDELGKSNSTTILKPSNEYQDPEHDRPIPRVSVAIVGEFLGMTMLVSIGCSHAVLLDAGDDKPHTEGGLLGVSFIWAFLILALVSSFGHVSGAHFNPSVTWAMYLYNRIPLSTAIGYFFGQMLGAVVGAAFVKAIAADQVGTYGATLLAPGVSVGRGFFVEAFLTFNLVFVVFTSAVCQDAYTKFAPLPIAGIIFAMVMLGGHITGGSMNPARSFGPALLAGEWDNHWIYWLGPFLGATLATFAYHMLRHYRRIHPNRKAAPHV